MRFHHIARRLVDHRRWMWRTFVLLCSAVVLRILGGLATVLELDAEWLYPLSTWACWLVPLLVLEIRSRSVSQGRNCTLPSRNAA
jgi:hypothetical protein